MAKLRSSTLVILFILFLVRMSVCLPQDSKSGCKTGNEPSRKTYFESFDNGCGGWVGRRHFPLAIFDGVAYSYGPWWVDANHAPPGAGYLHMLMWMYTDAEYLKDSFAWYPEHGLEPPFRNFSDNKFVVQNQSTDLTNARLTIRLRGEIDLQGSQLLLLVHGQKGGIMANYVLTGQPFEVTREWSEQTVTLIPDPSQWVCLGVRHDMTDTIGCYDISELLCDVNIDIIFVLFPLNVVTIGDIPDKDKLRPAVDYHVDQSFLPQGVVMFDWIKIEYADR